MEQRITVKNDQTLFDISLQSAGSIEAVFALAVLNGGLSITDPLEAGITLKADIAVVDADISEYLKKEMVLPSSGKINEEVSVLEGIGYWAIGIDFTVQ